MPKSPRSVYLNLDNAWNFADRFEEIDLRAWGPKLRYHGIRKHIDAFYETVRDQLTDFVLYGSGDFHYLAGVLLRRVQQPVTVISFDNHPDWDIRPPHWACGGWVNRALELPPVRHVSVWGCGNFELTYPSLLFANHKALRNGWLKIHAWEERQTPKVQRRFNCMSRNNWRDRFAQFASNHAGEGFYVTVDLDCLGKDEAVTNWENGLFTADDVSWAIKSLRAQGRVVAGDLCGAWSAPEYERSFQRFAARWDHPKLNVKPADAPVINQRALETIWPALIGGD